MVTWETEDRPLSTTTTKGSAKGGNGGYAKVDTTPAQDWRPSKCRTTQEQAENSGSDI